LIYGKGKSPLKGKKACLLAREKKKKLHLKNRKPAYPKKGPSQDTHTGRWYDREREKGGRSGTCERKKHRGMGLFLHPGRRKRKMRHRCVTQKEGVATFQIGEKRGRKVGVELRNGEKKRRKDCTISRT